MFSNSYIGARASFTFTLWVIALRLVGDGLTVISFLQIDKLGKLGLITDKFFVIILAALDDAEYVACT